jgi:hypothetical protein
MKKAMEVFLRSWTTLQRDGRDVHLIEAILTRKIMEL